MADGRVVTWEVVGEPQKLTGPPRAANLMAASESAPPVIPERPAGKVAPAPRVSASRVGRFAFKSAQAGDTDDSDE
jgi:hypothetical protein